MSAPNSSARRTCSASLAPSFASNACASAVSWSVGRAGIRGRARSAWRGLAIPRLIFAVFGPDPVYGFLVPVLFGAIAVIATYLLGKQVGGQSVGLASAALLATTPLILMYSRSFQFSIPAMAITALALLSLIKSERAQHWA